ncbi:hypothetical protein FGIG_09518, partial [Fasciola gigantica]
PQNVNIVHVNDTSHQISWTKVLGFPTKCQIYYEIRVGAVSGIWNNTYQTADNQMVLSNLNHSEKYEYYVRSRTIRDDVLSEFAEAVSLANAPYDSRVLIQNGTFVVIALVLLVLSGFIVGLCLFDKCRSTDEELLPLVVNQNRSGSRHF